MFNIVFVGTGMIGSGLAVNAALKGHSVVLYDVIETAEVKSTVRQIMDILVEAGAVGKDEVRKAFDRMKFTQDLALAVTGADFVQECVPERLELKRSVYRSIQELAGNKTVIASSTSGLFPSVLAEGALYPENIIVGHPYNPSYLLPLIEVCGPHASQKTIATAMEVYTAIGKEPVLCRKEAMGFIVNKLSWAVMDGAIQAVAEGICSVEDMDKALMFGPGMRMAVTGQLLTMSLGVPGGFRKMSQKYGDGEPEDREQERTMNLVADGVDEEIARRLPEFGNTVEDVIKFRDRAFVDILKLHKKI